MTDTGYPPRRLSAYVVVILLIASLCSYLDRHVMALVAPAIKQDLNVTDTEISLLTGLAFALFYATASIPLGWAADKWHRRNLIVVGITIWSAATIASGLAGSYTDLLIARVFVGFGEAALIPAAFSIIADYFPPHRRGRAFGVFSIGLFAGAGLAFIVGGAILRWFGDADIAVLPLLGETALWKAAFIIVGAPGLLVALLLLTVPEPKRLAPPKTPIAAGPPSTTLMRHFLSRPSTFVCVWGSYTLLSIIGFGFGAWATTMLVRKFDIAISEAGFAIGLAAMIGGITGALLGGVLGDRWTLKGVGGGKFRLTLVWWLGSIPAVLMFTLGPSQLVAALGYFLLFLFNGVGYVSASAVFQDIVPPRLRGRATAVWLLLTGLVGAGLGPWVIARITDWIFRDESALHYSLLVVAAPTIALGLAASLKGLALYDRAKSELG